MEPPANADTVRFGVSVEIDHADGRRETFRVVGEDEAEPGQGMISHISPLARALMGKSPDDVVRVNGAEIMLNDTR